MAKLNVNINKLELKNPVMTASGTFGYGWGQRGIPNPTTWTIGLSAKF